MAIGSQWGLGLDLYRRGEGVLFWICRGFHQLPLELTCGPSLKDKATGAHRWGPAVDLGIFRESPSIPEPV